MGKKKAAKKSAKKAAAKAAKKAGLPKTECCVSKKRCDRCPIRMLKEGTLPAGFAVKKRVLVRAADGKKVTKKDLRRAA